MAGTEVWYRFIFEHFKSHFVSTVSHRRIRNVVGTCITEIVLVA